MNYNTQQENKQFINLIVEFTAKKTERMRFRHIDPDYSTDDIILMNLNELLEYINADHSSNWIPYDETDWFEGMMEFTDLEFLG